MKPGEMLFSNSSDHLLFCGLGVFISIYSLYIEIRKHQNKNYKAMCDLSENMSCSKVLTSRYAKGFGVVELLFGKDHFLNIPNCLLGAVFYSSQILLGLINTQWAATLLYISSIVSCVGSLYLAFVLFVILKDVCLVCIATYIVNGALLYLNYQRYTHSSM